MALLSQCSVAQIIGTLEIFPRPPYRRDDEAALPGVLLHGVDGRDHVLEEVHTEAVHRGPGQGQRRHT